LTILGKEDANAIGVITGQLVIVSEAQELSHIGLRLPLNHLQQVGEGHEIFIARETLLILELEKHVMLSPLVNRVKDLDNHRYEDEEIGQCPKDSLICQQSYQPYHGQSH